MVGLHEDEHECMGGFNYDSSCVHILEIRCMIEGWVGGTFLHVAFYDGRSVQRDI